jgi:hypothetical protein
MRLPTSCVSVVEMIGLTPSSCNVLINFPYQLLPASYAFLGRENIVVGTDCGLGGRVHADLAWAKLRTLVEGARLASGSLWP